MGEVRRVLGFVLVVICMAVLGCGSEPATGRAEDGAGPNLVKVGGILLDESEVRYLGNPFTLVVEPEGSFLISDFFSNQVYRFARDGTLLSTFGRPGSGPGEFDSVGLVFVADDSTIVAADTHRNALLQFDRRTGEFRREVRHEGVLGMGGIATSGDTVWLAARNLQNRTMVLRWDRGTDEMRHVVPLAGEYLASAASGGRFASFHPYGNLTGWADTLLVGMSGLDELLVVNGDDEVLDSLRIPAARRRGVPHDIEEIFRNPPSARALFEGSSATRGLHRLPDGAFALVHHDSNLEGELPAGPITVDMYVSVLSRDRAQACLDAPVPVSRDDRPVQGFRGDTIFVLDRSITEAGELGTRIFMWRIDAFGCDWVPTY